MDSVNTDLRLVLTEEEINCCVKKCADLINKKFNGKNVIVVCILKGAVYFFTDLTRKLTIPHSCYFIEATSYHNNQTQSTNLSILSSINPDKFVDKHVVLLDELFDNGHTMFEIKKAIHEKANVPLEMIYTCVAFIKGKTTNYPPPDLFGIAVPDVWLVGYGLDDCQEKRNWTNLYACPKSSGIPENTDDIIFKSNDQYTKMRSSLCEFVNQKIFD